MSLLITLNNIEKHWQNTSTTAVLRSVSLSVIQGENIAITGPSGSGKSTLLNILGLLDQPSGGQYHLLGKNVSTLTPDQRAYRRNQTIGFVFQSFFLLPGLNALENIMLPLLYRRTPKSAAKDRAEKLLKQIGMHAFRCHYPAQLSGGQQQRIAIARALAGHPILLLADEPTGALDSDNSQKVIDLLFEFNQTQKTTLIVVSHDKAVYGRFSRLIRLHDGKIQT